MHSCAPTAGTSLTHLYDVVASLRFLCLRIFEVVDVLLEALGYGHERRFTLEDWRSPPTPHWLALASSAAPRRKLLPSLGTRYVPAVWVSTVSSLLRPPERVTRSSRAPRAVTHTHANQREPTYAACCFWSIVIWRSKLGARRLPASSSCSFSDSFSFMS